MEHLCIEWADHSTTKVQAPFHVMAHIVWNLEQNDNCIGYYIENSTVVAT
jgi:hypothetical protein